MSICPALLTIRLESLKEIINGLFWMLQVATNKFSHNLGINSRQVQSESRRKKRDIHQLNYLLCANWWASPCSGREARAGTGTSATQGSRDTGRQCGEQGADGRSVAGAGDGTLLLTACPVCDPGAALRDRKAIAGQPPRERKLLLCIWRG